MVKVTPKILDENLKKLHNDGIPEDLIEKIKEKVKDEDLEEEQLEYLLNKVFINYHNSLIEVSEPCGTVAAQSIGEPGTQMSVPGDELVIVRENSFSFIIKIGELVDDLIKRSHVLPSGDSTVCTIPSNVEINVPALGFDETVKWARLLQVSRHLPHGSLLQIETRSGRKIRATPFHSFVVRHENQIVSIRGDQLRPGNRIPMIGFLPSDFSLSGISLDVYIPRDEVWYGTELHKAAKSIERLGRDWKGEFNRTYKVPVGEDQLRNAVKSLENGLRNNTDVLRPGLIYPTSPGHSLSTTIPEVLELNSLTGWFIGAYLSEGTHGGGNIGITNSDETYRSRAIQFADYLKVGYSIKDSRGEYGPSTTIFLHSSILAKLFEKMCGRGADNKFIPQFAINAPIEFVRALLRAYFGGDGNFQPQRSHIRASSNSKRLIDGICLLLSRFGIYASKSYEGGQYHLRIPGKFAPTFRDQIGVDIPYKMRDLKIIASNEERKVREGDFTYDVIDMIPSFGTVLNDIRMKLRIDSKGAFAANIRKVTKSQKIGRQTLGRYITKFKEVAIRQNQTHEINNLLNILLRAYQSDVVWDEIEHIRTIRSPTRYVYDFAVDGLETFTTAEGLITHNTLRTFHYAGVEEFSVTQGLPRLIEIVDARRFPSTPQMEVYLEPGYSESEDKAIIVHNRIEQIRIEQITHDVDLDFVNWNIVINLIPEICEKKGIDIDEIPEILKRYKKKGSIKREGNSIIIDPGIEDLQSLQKMREKILKKVIKGIRGLKRGLLTPSDDNQEWMIKTEGTNLQGVVQIDGVDAKRTVSNHIHEIEKLYGIEAARNKIINESQKVLDQQGLDVDLRHLLILADLMCTSGTIQSIGRHGISGSKSSVFARAAFEVTVNQLLDAGLYGEEEKLLGIPENVIIGQVCPIGTGRTQIMFDLDANLEILKKKK